MGEILFKPPNIDLKRYFLLKKNKKIWLFGALFVVLQTEKEYRNIQQKTMKTVIISIIFILSGLILAHAQENFPNELQENTQAVSEEISAPEAESVPIKVKHDIAEPKLDTEFNLYSLQPDSLHLPLLNDFGQMPSYGWCGMYPLYWGGLSSWRLHQGLNINIGASVFAEFGKHARRGAGFGQNIALQYATPLTDKLSLSVGGYFNNVYWQQDSYQNVGLSAVLGYKFNEKWEAYVYGQKSIMQTNNIIPRPMYYWDEVGDKIGAAVKYNFSDAFSVQLSVEEHIYPQYQTHVPTPYIRNPHPQMGK